MHTGRSLRGWGSWRRCSGSNVRRVHDRGVRLAVRVGIHTGLVVMSTLGEGDARAPLALGQTPTIAAQVQGLAPPDTVVISPATLRLVEGYVVTQALGTYRLDDASEPLVALPGAPGACRPRVGLRSRSRKGLTPLVGREQELGLLRERWAQARDGLGQVVVLSGEAGIGKSRLVQALTEHLAGDVHTRLECHCSPYAQQSALYPVIEQLKHRLQWRQETHTAGEAPHPGSSPGAVWLGPGGGGAAAGRAAGAPPAGALSAAHPGTPAPEAEDARSHRGLVAQGGGAAAGMPDRGGSALGRPLHAGVAQPAPRPGAHGAHARAAARSPRVSPAVAAALVPAAPGPAPLIAPAGGDDGGAPHGRQGACPPRCTGSWWPPPMGCRCLSKS